MFYYFLSLSTTRIIIISAQNLKLKINSVNSVIAECYFIVIWIPYLFIDNLRVAVYLVPILSAYNKKFYNDG